MITLTDLRNAGELQIRFTRKPHTARLSRQTCVYFELVSGQKNDRGWVSYSVIHSSDPVTIWTELGSFELPINTLRLYIDPVYSRVITWKNIGDYLTFVQELLKKEGQPQMNLEEYCLAIDKSYYALVRPESYQLPPETPGSEPVECENPVFWVSDLPFKNGRPQRELTPHFRGFTY